MKKQRIGILNFNKKKIASLSLINSLYGGSEDCGDPGGSNTKDKSEDVKRCPKNPNSGSPHTCVDCPPDMGSDNC